MEKTLYENNRERYTEVMSLIYDEREDLLSLLSMLNNSTFPLDDSFTTDLVNDQGFKDEIYKRIYDSHLHQTNAFKLLGSTKDGRRKYDSNEILFSSRDQIEDHYKDSLYISDKAKHKRFFGLGKRIRKYCS